ncbi:MAG: HAMP domain-containing protein [Desulfuromonadales bacterium]|nr:HAMP domain-containing protein [Desulfuromonadales bacterium]MBN2793338.1 HAMP domain-containing protein [Desulfuromonadales bacterium]
MRSLFLKIFLYFLLIILLVSGAVVVLTFFRDQEFPPLAHQNFARAAIVKYGRDAIREYEREGLEDLQEYLHELQDESGIQLLLFDHLAQPLTYERVPRRMQHMAQRALRSGEVVFPMMGERNGLASLVKGLSGKTYVVAMNLPDRPPKQHLLRGITHGFLGWQLLILLVVTAGVCFVLARSLTAPITKLREATRSFASGDLSVRIGKRIKGKNEISALAHDFDEMATKIESLIGSQKRLLRDISHELRSPLTRLGIALELIRNNANAAARQKALERIELEAERMNTMIGQLLSLTRFETSAENITFENVDLFDLLERLVQDANYEAETRHCTVLFASAEHLFVKGSPELLKQAFENVIRNAVKYTADHSEVHVRMRREVDELVIEIVDQGPGVPEETLEKLFDPFYRVADARERETGGTGIGLAIAERSVHLHGGSIAAKNRPDGGLAVKIILPLNN